MRRRRAVPDERDLPLLDQVSSQQLARASRDYQARALEVPLVPANPGGHSRAGRILMAALLPPCMFALAGVMLFGLTRGVAGNLAGDGGFSAVDVAMLALLILASIAVFAQGLGLLRQFAWGRRLIVRGRAKLPGRKQRAEPEPAVALPLMLDQVSVDALRAAAPADLGNGRRTQALAAAGWRTGDTLLWIVLGVVSVAVAVIAAFGLGFSVWRGLERGSMSLPLLLLGVVCGMAFLGLGMMARITVLAIFDRRRRRRRPAFIRLIRYGTKPKAQGDAGRGQSSPASAVVAALGAVVILSVALWPEVTRAFDEIRSDGVSAVDRDTTPTPSFAGGATSGPTQVGTPPPSTTTLPTSAPPTPTPASGGDPATPTSVATSTPSPASTPTTSATGTPSVTATTTPTATSTPSATPSPPRTIPTPTASPTFTLSPTPTPTPLPTPTPAPTPAPVDTDLDGVPNSVETQYGSNPSNSASTPEDLDYNPATCGDGVDNDKDGSVDSAGGGGLGPDAGCQ